MADWACGERGEGAEGIGEPEGRLGVEKIPTGAEAAPGEARAIVFFSLNCFTVAAGTWPSCRR